MKDEEKEKIIFGEDGAKRRHAMVFICGKTGISTSLSSFIFGECLKVHCELNFIRGLFLAVRQASSQAGRLIFIKQTLKNTFVCNCFISKKAHNFVH